MSKLVIIVCVINFLAVILLSFKIFFEPEPAIITGQLIDKDGKPYYSLGSNQTKAYVMSTGKLANGVHNEYEYKKDIMTELFERRLTKSTNYKNGLLHGTSRYNFIYHSRDIYYLHHQEFKNGEQHGEQRQYDIIRGSLRRVEQMRNGELHGETATYEPTTGKIKIKSQYLNNELQPHYEVYDHSGELLGTGDGLYPIRWRAGYYREWFDEVCILDARYYPPKECD